MGMILAELNYEDATAPIEYEFPGKNLANFSLTAMGPNPGPPPPCGIEKVLCKFK